jgi:hypothetical protein
VQAIVNIYERQRDHSISWTTYRWGVVAFLVAAFFVVWRKTLHRAEKAEESLQPRLNVEYDNDKSLFDAPRSATYRLRVSNLGITTIDGVRVRVMNIPTAPQLAGVLPITLREQHGGEAPFTLNNTALFIDLLEYSEEQMGKVTVTTSSGGTDDGQSVTRRLEYAALCNDSRSPRILIDCGEGSVNRIEIEVEGRDVLTCRKQFRVRSLLPARRSDGADLEITEI